MEKKKKKKYIKPQIKSEKIGEGRLKPAVVCDGNKTSSGRKDVSPCTVLNT